MRRTDPRAAGAFAALLLLCVAGADGGFTTYSVDAREFGERQAYGIQSAHFAPGLAADQNTSCSLQLHLGDQGPAADLPGGGIGFAFSRRIAGDWSAGLGIGSMSSNVGSWWISAQAARHWESDSGWRLSAQLAASHHDLGGEFAILCEVGPDSIQDRYFRSARLAHVYEHLLLSKATGRVRWLFDVGHLGSYPTYEEGVNPFGDTNNCDHAGDEAIHQLTVGVGAGIMMGNFELGLALHGRSAGLHLRWAR